MKNHNLLFRGYTAMLLLLLIACTKDPADLPQAQTERIQETSTIAAYLDDVDNISFYALQNNGIGLRTGLALNGDLCSSATVKVNESTKSIVVDFGNGCTSPNGMTRKGKLLIKYSGLFFVTGTSVVVTFDNYFVNGNKIEGTKTTTNKGFDGKEFSFETIITGGKVTWPDNSFGTIDGNQLKKFKVTLDPFSLAIEVTGQATGLHRLGLPYSTTIQQALSYLHDCTKKGNWVPSSGTLKLVSGGEVFDLDFGSGDCDKEVKVTHNGNTFSIKLD
jgi:hypothetical protein